MYNRFGFSTAKKSDQHRSSSNTRQSFASSASVNRPVSSAFVNRNAYLESNSVSRPQPSQQLFTRFSNNGKLSTGKPFNYNTNKSALSTAKSSRVIRTPSLGFGSGRKNLFGVTPQHSRASTYSTQNAASTSRISRSSVGTRNRPLSDPAYHHDCQEKIVTFLNSNDFQITKQNLVRPSLGDLSQIFQFSLSHIFSTNIEINIKSGLNTSIDVVVPNYLAQLGYPAQLKRSDLVSCSGGRQLGAVLESICFLIDCITYRKDAEISFLNNEFELNEFSSGTSQIDTQLLDIVLSNNCAMENGEEMYQETHNRLIDLALSMFGTEEEVEEMKVELKKLDQVEQKIAEDTAKQAAKPNLIQEYKDKIKICDEYIDDVNKSEVEMMKTKQDHMEKIPSQKENLNVLLQEQQKLEADVKLQANIIMDYRLAVERKKQILDQIEQEKAQIKTLSEQIVADTIRMNDNKAKNRSCINDMEDVISTLFSELRSSKMNQMSENFVQTFEKDKEWQAIYSQLKRFKELNVDQSSEQLVQDIKTYGQRLQNKFKDIKNLFLQQLNSLNGSASVDLICKKQELQIQHEKKKQELVRIESELQQLINEKEFIEREQMNKLTELNAEIESYKKTFVELNENKFKAKDQERSIESNFLRVKQDKENSFLVKADEIMTDYQDRMEVVKQKKLLHLNQMNQHRDQLKKRLALLNTYYANIH